MSFEPFNFDCPYCNRSQVVTEVQYDESYRRILIQDGDNGDFGYSVIAVGCSNNECRKSTIVFQLIPYIRDYLGNVSPNESAEPIIHRRIIPQHNAKPQPDFIPAPLREDYVEACLVRDLSPKASATLSRRCLQGMIRNFCSISKGRLIDEINELKKRVVDGNAPKGVSEESVDAIDHVRGIGNIGAHMEKDIDHIVPVDPDEAQLLIELIESLFEEWYVAREKRSARFSSIKALAEDKKKLIAEIKNPQIEGPKPTE